MDRLGDDDNPLLNEEAECYLRSRFSMRRAHFSQHRICEYAVKTFGQRPPGFHCGSMFLHKLNHRPLLVEDVGLDLVDGGNDGRIFHQCLIRFGVEIRHTDCAEITFLHQVLKSLPDDSVVPHRPMDEHEVQIIQLHAPKRPLHILFGLVVGRPGQAKLGGDEKLVAGNAGLADRRSYHGLVLVVLSRIQRAVSHADGIKDTTFCDRRVNQINAISENGHFYAIVEGGRKYHGNDIFYLTKILFFLESSKTQKRQAFLTAVSPRSPRTPRRRRVHGDGS